MTAKKPLLNIDKAVESIVSKHKKSKQVFQFYTLANLLNYNFLEMMTVLEEKGKEMPEEEKVEVINDQDLMEKRMEK